MSNSSSKTKIQLDVETKDETADVYVIDSSFRVIARGRGIKQTFQLKPGIYTVKVRVGFESHQKDLVLIDKPENVTFDEIEFSSAIPLCKTARTHEYQTAAAERESRKIHINNGKGSWIFIFARDWKPSDSEKRLQTTSLPHKGLKLKNKDNEVIIDFETNENVACDQSQDAWAACNIELDPGQYRLSVEIKSGKTIEQTIVACRGWQTQVFLLQKNYDHKKTTATRRADLTNTGILMARGEPDKQYPQLLTNPLNKEHPKMFNADDPKMRLLDLARLGLAHNRQVLPDDDVDRILEGKFKNPMLGLLGAQLLLKGKKIRLGLFKEVVENLRRILGEGTHPDLEALVLRVENKKARYNFDLPPMLRQSWIQVVKSTAARPDLIPLDSFACQNSEQMLGDEPWLLYLSENQNAEEESVNESIRYLVKSQFSRERSASISNLKTSQTPIRQNVFRSANITAQSELMSGQADAFEKTSDAFPKEAVTKSIPAQVDDQTVKNLVSTMGLPKARVIQILKRLES